VADDVQQLTNRPASEVLTNTDRVSVGVVRVLSGSVGSPAEEREYEPGDEALVEAGRAEWVVAPVHLPEAGRRLDHDAEREALPLDGVEVYPPAEPTSPQRRAEARVEGSVDAHTADGLAEQLAARRAELVRGDANDEGDAKLQAALGGTSARSGPVTATSSDLSAENLAGGSGGDVETAASASPDPAGDGDSSSSKTTAPAKDTADKGSTGATSRRS
jgi:hypothetical protein